MGKQSEEKEEEEGRGDTHSTPYEANKSPHMGGGRGGGTPG